MDDRPTCSQLSPIEWHIVPRLANLAVSVGHIRTVGEVAPLKNWGADTLGDACPIYIPPHGIPLHVHYA